MRYYLKQKIFAIGDKYNIFHEDESPAYTVQSQILSIGAKLRLHDLQGNELFFIKQKIALLPTYEIYKGETLCAIVRKKIAFLAHKIEVESAYGNFQIDGDAFAFSFDIKLNGNFVGAISKKLLSWGDTYEINIADDQDQAFMCALVIAIDNCEHNHKD